MVLVAVLILPVVRVVRVVRVIRVVRVVRHPFKFLVFFWISLVCCNLLCQDPKKLKGK